MAMIAAAAFTVETTESARGRPSQGKAKAAKAAGVSPERFGHALTVKQFAPELVRQVIDAAGLTLDAAYHQANACRMASGCAGT